MLNDLHHQALVEFWDFVKFGYNEGQLALKKKKNNTKDLRLDLIVSKL